MSDIPQAPDWWQANDGKWYPPQPGQAPADPFAQMQQGTPAAPPAPGTTPFANLGVAQSASRGCMSLGMVITIATLLIGGAITAVVLFAVRDASDTINETFDTNDEAIDSAEVTDCGRGDFGYARAVLDVTNDGDDTATYFVEVTFESRNGNRQFGTANATVTGLQSGNTTSVETLGATEVPGEGRFTCRVTSVDRIQTG